MKTIILKIKKAHNYRGINGKLALVKCNICGKKWWVPYSVIKNGAGKHCSSKCYSETLKKRMSNLTEKELEKRGKAISIGKGNKTGWRTNKNTLIRQSKKYKEWRKSVFVRDDYTCQICGKRGVKLNVDHIKSFALYPELRFDITNGRTLCEECHKETDTYLSGALRDPKTGRFISQEKFL